MITTIIGVVVIGYIALMLLGAIFSIGFSIWMGDWKGCVRDFGYFIYLNGGLAIGLGIGMFTIVNLLNWMTEGYFAINMFNPNKWGIIFLAIGIVFHFVGKEMKRDREMEEKRKELYGQAEHKYVTLKSGRRVQID